MDSLTPKEVMALLPQSNRIIIELGANDGSTTEDFLCRMDKSDKIFCIEADPRCIRKHILRIHDSRCKLYHVAINDYDGNANFHMCTAIHGNYGFWDHASSLKPIKHGLMVNPWLRYDKDIVVESITLDTFTKNNHIKNVDFIWCDVEGNYAEVVKGGLNTLCRTRYFYTECEDVETYEGEIMYPALRVMMESIGWELVERFKYDALFRNLSLL